MLDPSHEVSTTAAVTAWCHTCGLKHTRRPDWLCPRCGLPVDTEPPPRRREITAPEGTPEFPLGSMIAGAVIAISSAALVIGFARSATGQHRWMVLGAALVGVVLALELLLKVSTGRWIAVAVAVVAAVVVSEGLLRELVPDLFRDPAPDLVRRFLRGVIHDRPMATWLFLGFDLGCLLLIVGRPRVVRIAAGVLLAAPLIVFESLHVLGR